MLKFYVMAQILRGRMTDLLADRKGVTSMEYGIIAAVTVAVVGTAIAAVGTPLAAIWKDVSDALVAANTVAATY